MYLVTKFCNMIGLMWQLAHLDYHNWLTLCALWAHSLCMNSTTITFHVPPPSLPPSFTVQWHPCYPQPFHLTPSLLPLLTTLPTCVHLQCECEHRPWNKHGRHHGNVGYIDGQFSGSRHTGRWLRYFTTHNHLEFYFQPLEYSNLTLTD